MQWTDAFPESVQPSAEDIQGYIGGEGGALFGELVEYMGSAYQAKPKIGYSGCSMKPGWNVKFQKGGQAFGTIYPEEGGFSVMVVLSYKLEAEMDRMAGSLSEEMRALWADSQDFMKLGRWMMFRVGSREALLDYQKIMAVKRAVKGGKGK